jgi:hypothetical protein
MVVAALLATGPLTACGRASDDATTPATAPLTTPERLAWVVDATEQVPTISFEGEYDRVYTTRAPGKPDVTATTKTTVSGHRDAGARIEDITSTLVETTGSPPTGGHFPPQGATTETIVTATGTYSQTMIGGAVALQAGRPWRVDPTITIDSPHERIATAGDGSISAGLPDPTMLLDEVKANVQQITDLGSETIRGDQTQHLRVDIGNGPPGSDPAGTARFGGSIPPGCPETVPIDLYIGSDGLARRVTLAADLDAVIRCEPRTATASTSDVVSVTIDWFDAGKPVTIAVPDASAQTAIPPSTVVVPGPCC